MRGQVATPTNYSACIRIRIQVLNISRDKIFVVNVQPAKTAKIFNLENFRLYGIMIGNFIIISIQINTVLSYGIVRLQDRVQRSHQDSKVASRW